MTDNCKLCGSEEAFSGACGGGCKNPDALCYQDRPAADGLEVVARLLTYRGRGTYPPQGYTIARTWAECSKNAYPYDWPEGGFLVTFASAQAAVAAERAECGRHIQEVDASRDRITQLEAALKVANSNHEEFERKWYLETDRTEKLKAALVLARGELRSVLASINADKIPFDGDSFHEALATINNLLGENPGSVGVNKT